MTSRHFDFRAIAAIRSIGPVKQAVSGKAADRLNDPVRARLTGTEIVPVWIVGASDHYRRRRCFVGSGCQWASGPAKRMQIQCCSEQPVFRKIRKGHCYEEQDQGICD